MKLVLLNTTIATTNGTFRITDLSLENARELAQANIGNFENGIGHKATADTLGKLLGIEINADRVAVVQEKGQLAIVLKLNGRVQEGQILSQEEMEKMGYSLKLMEKLDD